MTEKTNETHLVTPGKLLSAAREARGLSQEDIAKRTCLSVHAISNIERDEYAQFGVRTFVRGYLCTYARLVGASEAQVLEALDASGLMSFDTHSVLPRIEGVPVTNVTHQQSQAINPRWIIAGAGAFLLIVLIAWWQSPKDDSAGSVQTKKTQPLAIISQPAVVTSDAAPSVETAAPIVASTESASAPVVAAAPVSEPVAKQHKKIHAHKKNKKVETAALHTTYKVTPAT